MTAEELNAKSKEILEMAENSGVSSHLFFVTTFDRYIKQIETMSILEKSFEEEGVIITKEYVKGRGNLCVNPALKEYNNMVTSANKTVTTLIRIIKEFEMNKKTQRDPLMELLNMNEEE